MELLRQELAAPGERAARVRNFDADAVYRCRAGRMVEEAALLRLVLAWVDTGGA